MTNVTCLISEECFSHQAIIHCSCPQPRALRIWAGEKQDTGPRYLRWISKHDFNESRLLHLPIQRKALNSLTWDVSFSLISSHLLMSWDYLGFCFVFCFRGCFLVWFLFLCKTTGSYRFWLFPYLSRTIPQSYLRGCLPGSSPQYVCQIKHNPQTSLVVQQLRLRTSTPDNAGSIPCMPCGGQKLKNKFLKLKK